MLGYKFHILNELDIETRLGRLSSHPQRPHPQALADGQSHTSDPLQTLHQGTSFSPHTQCH